MIFLAAASIRAQPRPPDAINYDESKVGAYSLPDPLVMHDGRAVTDSRMWQNERRVELLNLFRTQVYGLRPPKPQGIQFRVVENSRNAVNGQATRKRIRAELQGAPADAPAVTITLLIPNTAAKPVPAFVGMSLFDSSAAEPMPGRALDLDVKNAGKEALPGTRLLEVIFSRGYAIATLDANAFCPDDKARFRDGVLSQLFPGRSGPPGPDEPGAIATWAWGLSRALDYFETDADIDPRRVAVIGHSRMGKTALWAGAEDERFALVISNNSGCGGAALNRRDYGETIGRITSVFPHWFCGNFSRYAGLEETLPVDQHELIALIAPRPVYIASAEQDQWADPRGEYLAALSADRVYQLLGARGIETAGPDLPAIGKSVGHKIGYHIRAGKHALTDFDWLRYLDFADRHFGKSAK